LRLNFSEKTTEYTLFDRKRNEESLEEFKVEPVDKKLRKYKSNWPCNLKCNKNEQQQDAKNKAELQTKWTSKTCEETIRGSRNKSIMT
jgi:hypothetical protein